MLLSQKLNQLQEDTNKQTGFSDEMMLGFSECIKHAEALESKGGIDAGKVEELMKWVEQEYKNLDKVKIDEQIKLLLMKTIISFKEKLTSLIEDK